MKTTLWVASLLATLAQPSLAGPDETLSKAGCLACHAQDKKVLGPSFKDIAAKYRGQKDAAAQLTDKVRKGGKGNWGPIPMPPSGPDKLSDAELRTAVEFILAQ
ncbi:MAG TPA: c-type cytochrome [Roseateles sp.]